MADKIASDARRLFLEVANGTEELPMHLVTTREMLFMHQAAVYETDKVEVLRQYVIRREKGVEIGPVTIGPGPWYCHEVPLCPSCHSGKPEEGHTYCPNCGARLEWGGE